MFGSKRPQEFSSDEPALKRGVLSTKNNLATPPMLDDDPTPWWQKQFTSFLEPSTSTGVGGPIAAAAQPILNIPFWRESTFYATPDTLILPACGMYMRNAFDEVRGCYFAYWVKKNGGGYKDSHQKLEAERLQKFLEIGKARACEESESWEVSHSPALGEKDEDASMTEEKENVNVVDEIEDANMTEEKENVNVVDEIEVNFEESGQKFNLDLIDVSPLSCVEEGEIVGEDTVC